MKPYTFFLGLFTVMTLSSFIAIGTPHNIAGVVTDKDKKPASFVSVLLLKSQDSSLVKGDVSNDKGEYQFDEVANGEYIISSTNIGYKKYYSPVIVINDADVIHNIALSVSEMALKEVKVLAKKPMIEVKADKTVFNVEQSINASGTNALELLRKCPGVRVDKDDNVEMRGKNNVLIYIDGKPTYMDNKDLAAMLKNMQSNNIESIELIANPSAKYDASGNAGIINIKLKKNKKFGTNGNVNLGIAQGKYFKQNLGLSLNNRSKKVNVFGNYSLNNGKDFNFQNFDRTQNNYTYNFKSKNISDGINHSLKAGVDYYLNAKNVIGIMVNGMSSTGDFNSESKTLIGPANAPYNQVMKATNKIPITRKNGNANLNYKFEDTSGHSLNIDVDYGNFSSKGRSYQPNFYWNQDETAVTSEAIYKSNTANNIHIYSGKADYEQNLMKGKLGVGIKSALVNTDNDFQFYDVINNLDTLNVNRTNRFLYKENVNAAYLNFSRAFNKLSIQMGIRAEHTHSKGMLSSATPQNDDTVEREYLNFFPSAGFSYTINAKHQLGITYSRRIDRPNYQDLNPFEIKLDELTYEKGNAFLRPQYTNTLDLTHTFMQYFTTSLSYSHVRDMFMQTTDTTEFSRTYVTQKNFATMDIAGINISFPVPVKKWWMVMANINANYNQLQADFEGRKLSNQYYTYTFYADNTFTLPNDFSVNISGWYSGPNYWGGTFKLKPMGSLDLGMQKTFMKKKLTAKLSLSDVFKTQRWYAISNFSGLYVDANGNYESRQLRLNVSYRFGSNQVERQRDRKSGADSENSRIKGK
ncbi:MAG: TonB-dependent receptor [Bacteroidetes bacterium]|nr:TonB-dependent receptor [Bacteroidota bacterium]